MSKPIVIYALKDPFTNEIRYIGKTDNPTRRLWQHKTYGKNLTEDTYVYRWIHKLYRKGAIPLMIELEKVHPNEWVEAEIAWIEFASWCGWPLTNTANGGIGNGGFHNSVKTHCPKGHPYDEENTYHYKDGRRGCNICKTAIYRSEPHLTKARLRSAEHIKQWHESQEYKDKQQAKKDRLEKLAKSSDIIASLKARRVLLHYTVQQLSNMMAVSSQTIGRWENYKIIPPIKQFEKWKETLKQLEKEE